MLVTPAAHATTSAEGQAIVTPTPRVMQPQTATHFKKIAIGSNFVLTLLNNDTLVMWGDNRKWQSTIPYRFKDTLFSDIATGASVSYVLDQTGNVSAWSSTYETDESQVPIDAQSGVTAIAAGTRFAMALKTDGTVVAWGRNQYGQARVPVGLSDVIAVAAGDEFSLALTSAGQVVAWGRNQYGQARVPAGLSDVIALAAGSDHALALRFDGTGVAWGNNSKGHSSGMKYAKDEVQVGAGREYSVILRADGTITAFGSNYVNNINFPRNLANVVW